ncbi:MAG TPA: hypothetical protein PK306_18790 [Aquabacterium sp.]|nr:hypothetical protein [Aquabacterium sp.]HQC97753.1 hypothetical protein [Aquabacterium sp.]
MNAIRILAIVAVAVGVLGIGYGGFSYTSESTVAKLGPLELKAEQEKRVNLPLWAGVTLVVAGAGALVLAGRK